MARKASDLLDVFRMRPAGSDDGEPARRPAKKGAKKPKAKRTASKPRRRAGEAVSVSKRQLLYAGSVVVLLMALSFVLGVSMTGDGSSGPALNKQTEKPWYVMGYLPKTSLLAGKPIDIRKAVRELYNQHGVTQDDLDIFDLGRRYLIRFGPFPTRPRAFQYVEAHGLTDFRPLGETPFHPANFSQKPMP